MIEPCPRVETVAEGAHAMRLLAIDPLHDGGLEEAKAFRALDQSGASSGCRCSFGLHAGRALAEDRARSEMMSDLRHVLNMKGLA